MVLLISLDRLCQYVCNQRQIKNRIEWCVTFVFLSSCTDSPPPLAPHWEHTTCSGSTSLPESIMAHWQQMSSNVSSDKIMFDFEDTSYEIKFSPKNEDSTASSICAPFEFPHLIDESKSGFNTIFRKNSTESCGW